MNKKDRINKILDSLPSRFYFDKIFESGRVREVLKDVDLCYKKTKENDLLNCSPLLTKDQEYKIFRKFNYQKYKLLKSTIGFPKSKDGPKPQKSINLNRVKEKYLERLEDLLLDIENLRNILLKANLRLIYSRVHKFYPIDTFQREEFFSNGYCHVLKAIDHFDFRRGFKFSTYCVRVLQSNLLRDYTLLKKREERYPYIEQNFIEDSREENYEDINSAYNKNYIKNLLLIMKKDKNINNPEVKIKILLDYYTKGKKLREIGDDLKISKERVRQIKLSALEYLGKNSPVYDPLL